MVSQLHCALCPEFYIKFDINQNRLRISEYCPGDSDTQPVSTHYDESWEARLGTANTWAARVLRYVKNEPLWPPPEPDGPSVVYIEAGKPRTAHIELEKLLEKLTGEVRICDPYYGSGKLLRLDAMAHCHAIKLLTQKPDSGEKATLARAILEYTKEHSQVQFRQHTVNDLHDRFILSDDELVILGQGLKDVGNKESFIIRLTRALAGDLVDSLRTSFDTKWDAAKPIH